MALLEGEGMTPRALGELQQLVALSRVDYAVLYSVVAVMVLKPTGDDVGVLAVLAAIVAGTAVWGRAPRALRRRGDGRADVVAELAFTRP